MTSNRTGFFAYEEKRKVWRSKPQVGEREAWAILVSSEMIIKLRDNKITTVEELNAFAQALTEAAEHFRRTKNANEGDDRTDS